jgi:hypothetical protein
MRSSSSRSPLCLKIVTTADYIRRRMAEFHSCREQALSQVIPNRDYEREAIYRQLSRYAVNKT